MLRLTLPDEPYWLDLVAGARVKVKPLSTPIHNAARLRAWADAEKESGARRDAEGKFVEGTDFFLLNALYNGFFGEHLARYGIAEWEGVGAPDGTPVDCTPENITRLMRIPAVGTQFLSEYTKPISAVISEGNG